MIYGVCFASCTKIVQIWTKKMPNSVESRKARDYAVDIPLLCSAKPIKPFQNTVHLNQFNFKMLKSNIMNNFIRSFGFTAIFTFCFAAISFAQINNNNYGAGDQNMGDLDVLEQEISVCVELETILQLHAPDDPSVCFVFDEMEEFKQGLKAENPTNGGAFISDGVKNGIHQFGVDATVNWKLDWRADINGDFVKGENWSGNRKQKLAINNIGAKFSTDRARNMIQPTDNGAVALTNRDFTIIKRKNGHSNIGAKEDNKFEVIWRVGTQERPQRSSSPKMNEQSLLEQQIGSEAFKFDVIFTLSQDDPWIN